MVEIPHYDYKFAGYVESGNQIGRKMGIPTVNVPVDESEYNKGEASKDLPKLGVYAASVMADEYGLLKGIANIGRKPTVLIYDSDGNVIPNPLGVEVFIFDFDGDLYNKNITIYLHEFVREEKKFADFQLLKTQIEEDIEKTKDILVSLYENT